MDNADTSSGEDIDSRTAHDCDVNVTVDNRYESLCSKFDIKYLEITRNALSLELNLLTKKI